MLVDILFDGPPSHISGRFIEVVDSKTGKGLRIGEWIQMSDGKTWSLRINVSAPI